MSDVVAKTLQAVRSDAVSGNTLITGDTIDRAGYGTLNFVLHTGVLTTGGATYAVTMEDGNAANMSDAAAVSTQALGLNGTLPTILQTQPNTTFKLGYIGGKRYVRLKVQPAGSTGAASISAIALLGRPAFTAPGNVYP